jgi:hypothetical protein
MKRKNGDKVQIRARPARSHSWAVEIQLGARRIFVGFAPSRKEAYRMGIKVANLIKGGARCY